jgi:hypothetical protein
MKMDNEMRFEAVSKTGPQNEAMDSNQIE